MTQAEENQLIARIVRTMAEEHGSTHHVVVDMEQLFRDYRKRLVAYCTRFMGDPNRGEDVAHDTVITAWAKLPDFRGDSRFSTFLFGIARNHCLRALRSRRDALLEDQILEPVSHEASPLKSLTREERVQLMREASAGLPALEQEAVHLRYVEGLPYKTIERLLDLDLTVFKSGARGVLQRCKRWLKARLRERLIELGHGSSFIETR